MKVLIAEDNPTNRKLLRAVLEAEGYGVVAVFNGREALAALEREPVNAIISDILMPEMDGYRLCLEVRKSERFRHLPFIFYTATCTTPSDEKLARELGADEYLKKPASAKTVLEVLQKVITSPSRGAPTMQLDEVDVLKQYSERLVSKLEETNIELEVGNEKLRLQTTALESAANAALFRNAILSAQMDVTINGILVVDKDSKVISYNSRFADIWGIPTELLVDGNDKTLLRIEDIYEQRCETSRDEIVLKDGRILDRYSAPMCGPDGRYFGRVWYFHDVTERRQTEADLRNSREQLRALAAHLHTTREEESLRISRAIHDELGHALTSLSLDLAALEKSLAVDPSPRDRLLLRAKSMSKLVEDTTHAVQRIVMDLRPSLLDDLGLTAALEWLVEEFAARTGIRVHWRRKMQVLELPNKQAIVVFRIFQETLTNIARHSRAINGKLEIRSVPSQGTTVILTLPTGPVADKVASIEKTR
jgi:signal transduction histidine kinase/CheY-like chemotaxis protein